MKKYLPLCLLALLLILSYSCKNPAPVIQDRETYVNAMEQWQQERLEGLKAKDGWLNLAGIYWLKEGKQTLGSDPSNDIVFPEKAPAFIGTLKLRGETVHLKVNEAAKLHYLGEQIQKLELSANRSGNPAYITHGDFAWYIMKRHTSLAIRLRDYKNPALEATDHLPSWPINPDYVVEARLLAFDEPKTITVNTPFQDYTQEYQCPGELEFQLQGQKHKLLPFTSGEGYFIILSDESSGLESYGGGRYMYSYPDSTGRIILDFNKAYNPPCAITPFAACPMPPPENHLGLKIEAGEKSLAEH